MQLRGLALGFALVLATSGCGARAWRQALANDEPAAYHRFLREHGASLYAGDAQRHLEFARLREHPNFEAWRDLRKRYPDDVLVAELQSLVEQTRFAEARAAGSVAEYREFLLEFPESDLGERARGNITYLEAGGYAAQPTSLASFLVEHPESDYAEEAQRSLALAKSARRRMTRIGLLVELPSSVAGRDQLGRDFRERAHLAWHPLGVEVVDIQSVPDLDEANLSGLMRIEYREATVPASMRDGFMALPGLLAQTRVLLDYGDGLEQVWRRSFEVRVRASQRTLGSSVLYSPVARTFWRDFFVPVASWPTARAVRAPLRLLTSPVAVDLEGSRAAVLAADGSFEVHDIGDAANPVRVAAYRRPRDLASFHGILLRGRRVVIYGADGIEIVSIVPEGTKREMELSDWEFGAVRGVEVLGDSVVAATTRGLLHIGPDETVSVWMEGAMRGVARKGSHLLFGDQERLYSARPEQLKDGRLEGSLRVPRGLGDFALRVEGSRLVMLGRRSVLWVDVDNPASMHLAARVELRKSGPIADAGDIGGRLLLLGDRGLQVLDAGTGRVLESLDVQARQRFSLWGRHAVLVGDEGLQVVDLTPFLDGAEVPEGAAGLLQRADSRR